MFNEQWELDFPGMLGSLGSLTCTATFQKGGGSVQFEGIFYDDYLPGFKEPDFQSDTKILQTQQTAIRGLNLQEGMSIEVPGKGLFVLERFEPDGSGVTDIHLREWPTQ